MKLYTVIMVFFLSIACFAGETSVEGFGDTADSSRANAMAELSFVIYSNVKASLSHSASTDMQTSSEKLDKQTDITSELPLLGASAATEKTADGYKTNAYIGLSSVPAYESALGAAVDRINGLNAKYKAAADDSEKYSLLTSEAAELGNYEKLNRVYVFLSGAPYKAPDVTADDVSAALRGITEKCTSLRLCAKIMSRELNRQGAFIYYPTTSGSDEVTEFSGVFHDLLAGYMSPEAELQKAKFFVNTEYRTTKDGMYITSSLTDTDGKTLGVSTKKIAPSAYNNLTTEPSAFSFEKLVKSGEAVSADFTARITTKNGKRAVLYKNGEIVELLIKVNKPSYVYISAHVMKKTEKYSYLVDLNDAEGTGRFIRYVGGDEINHWISLGLFKVVPPFGTEVFQMVASRTNPSDRLPIIQYDKQDGIYKISDDPVKGVGEVRALKRVDVPLDADAEDVLIFSSTDR